MVCPGVMGTQRKEADLAQGLGLHGKWSLNVLVSQWHDTFEVHCTGGAEGRPHPPVRKRREWEGAG